MTPIQAEAIRDRSPLISWPDRRLAVVSPPVDGMGPVEVGELFDLMWAVLRREGGWGLAAPQIGSLVRLIVVNFPGCQKIEMVNPVMVKHSKAKFFSEEGCLSFPGETVRIGRYRQCRLEGVDRWLRPVAASARDKQAGCMQHELDHLDGITIRDYGHRSVKGILAPE